MATESLVGIVIQARDEATRVLQQVRGELALFGPSGEVLVDLSKKAETGAVGLQRLGTSATGALSPLRSLSNELLGTVAPALGQVGTSMLLVTQATQRLALGLPLLAAAGAALATVLGVELFAAMSRSREALRAFQRDMDSADVSRITGQLRTLRSELEITDQRIRELGKLSGPEPGGFPSIFERIEEVFLAFQRRRQLERIEASAPASSAQFRGRERTEWARAEQLLPPEAREATDAQAQALARELQNLRRQLDDERATTTNPIERARRAGLRAAQQTLTEPGGGIERSQLAQAQRDLAEQANREARLRDSQSRRFADFAGAAAAFDESLAFAPRWDAASLAAQATTSQLARMEMEDYRRQREADLRAAEASGDITPAFSAVTGQQRAGISAQAVAQRVGLEREELELQRQMLEVQLQQSTLSDRQRDALTDRVTGLRTAQDLARVDAELEVLRAADETERDNARIERLQKERDVIAGIASVREQITARERELRDVPLEGGIQGLQDFEDMAARGGERFRSAFFQQMQTVGAGITEILVQGISGDFDRIGDIGKQMGQALMRSLLQEIVVTPLVSQLSQALRGALGSLTTPGATAAGAGGLAALLGLAPSAANAGAQVGVSASLPVGSVVSTAYGPATVAPSGALVLGGGATTGAGVSAGADFDPFVGAPGMESAAGADGAASAAGMVSTGLSAAAGAAVVGLAAYSGYQNATTTQDVVFAGVTGAIGGATSGAALGGVYGAIIGAIAGAAISSGAAAYGKSKNQPSAADREKAELSGVATSFQAMFADLDACTFPDELYAVVKRYTHQGAGGERSGNGHENAGLVVTVVVDGQPRRVIDGGVTPDQLVEFGGTTAVQIIAGVAPELKAPFEERIAQAIQQAAARIRSLGPRLFFTEQLAGGISRTTVLALSRLAEAAGQDINVVAATLSGLDAATQQKVLDRIAANDLDGAVGLYAVEANLKVVRIGQHLRIAPTGTGAPGGPDSGPPLTPEQIAELDAATLELQRIFANMSPGGTDQDPGVPTGEGPAGPIGQAVADAIAGLATGTPVGALGQAAAAAAEAAGASPATANAIGNAVNVVAMAIPGPIGLALGLANTVAGIVSLVAQGKPVTILGFRFGRPPGQLGPPGPSGLGDPDTEGPAPPGSVTVGDVSIVDGPPGSIGQTSTPDAPSDTSSTVGEEIRVARLRPARYPHESPARMSDEEILAFLQRGDTLNKRHDLKLFTGDPGPLTAAWAL